MIQLQREKENSEKIRRNCKSRVLLALEKTTKKRNL